ncbi:MAG: ZIP family metal transporter [Flavobacteriales bacterium]|nr:ZIP family metal transporter [Flavobacteriales bacterium]
MTTYILGLVISFAAGAWFIYKAPEKKQWIYLFLSAGGAYLITVLFTHILPELFENLGHTAGYVLLVGFIAQILLENYSHGIEHGHAHASSTRTALLISYAALCLHALIEGMPLASVLFNSVIQFDRELTLGIMLHKIPVAITLSTLLIRSGLGKNSAMLWLLGFIACTIVGSFVQHWLGNDSERLMFMSLGLTVGILLHVSTTILFESSDHHRLSPKRIAVIVLGILLGIAI